MTVPNSDAGKPADLDESATGAGSAAQLVPTEPPIEQGEENRLADATEGGVEADEATTRGPLQTREAYLKKGEDLIRSLL